MMMLDFKRAVLDGAIRRNVYIELLQQDPRDGNPKLLGKLKTTTYGMRRLGEIRSSIIC